MGILQAWWSFNSSSSSKIGLFHSTLSETKPRWFFCKFRYCYDSIILISRTVWLIHNRLIDWVKNRCKIRTFPNTLLFTNRNKMLENYFDFFLFENVFVRLSFFERKLVHFFIIIHLRFSFEKFLDAREFVELVAGSSWNAKKRG